MRSVHRWIKSTDMGAVCHEGVGRVISYATEDRSYVVRLAEEVRRTLFNRLWLLRDEWKLPMR
jgi:hypothetical protein